MSDRTIGFTFSVLIHLLLIVIFGFSFFREKPIPPSTVVIDVVMIGDVKKEKKITQNHHGQKTVKDDGNRPRHYHNQTENQATDAVKKVVPVANPLPQIPEDLRAEAFQSEAIARFYIDATGNVEKVDLVKPCANPRLNNLLLKSLRQWKFTPTENSSTQDIKVRFRVE